MQEQSKGRGDGSDGERLFDVRAILFHNRHFAVLAKRDPKCGFCSKGLEGVSYTPKQEIPAPSVDEDSRTDNQPDAPLSSTGRWYRETPARLPKETVV